MLTSFSTEEKQIRAVEKKWTNIKNIANPSRSVKMVAVKRNGSAIKYLGIRDRSLPEFQMAAYKSNPKSWRHFIQPTKAVLLEMLKDDLIIKNHDGFLHSEIELEVIRKRGELIRFVKLPSDDLKWEAVRQNPRAIRYIKDASSDMQHHVAALNPDNLRYVKKLDISVVYENYDKITDAGLAKRMHKRTQKRSVRTYLFFKFGSVHGFQ